MISRYDINLFEMKDADAELSVPGGNNRAHFIPEEKKKSHFLKDSRGVRIVAMAAKLVDQ